MFYLNATFLSFMTCFYDVNILSIRSSSCGIQLTFSSTNLNDISRARAVILSLFILLFVLILWFLRLFVHMHFEHYYSTYPIVCYSSIFMPILEIAFILLRFISLGLTPHTAPVPLIQFFKGMMKLFTRHLPSWN